jgi:hypothetical protein
VKTNRRSSRSTKWRIGGAILLAVLLWLAGGTLYRAAPAAAQGGDQPAGSGYDLSWWTVDGGGGGRSTTPGQAYYLEGTIGQPDAGRLISPTYTLTGGFWAGGPFVYRIYLPLVVRNLS